MSFQDIAAALAQSGLHARGGFHPSADEGVPEVDAGLATRTVIVIGSGRAHWEEFRAAQMPGAHPLDDWVRATVQAVAVAWGARAVFPSDRPFLPFQRWAQRAEDVHPSPLGVLIHPELGLWHAYRAALLFAAPLTVPERGSRPSPCDACANKPCLSACPAGSFGPGGFDSSSCHTHLETAAGQSCLEGGCRARDACPVGRDRRYGPDQIRFHMRAFHRAPP